MKKEQGFSTAEVLTATAITLVVLAGTMGSFNNSLGLTGKATEMADLEQNLRAGMNLMVGDFISAGWSIPIGGIPIPSGAGANAVIRPGPSGHTYTFTSQSISAVNPGAGLGPDVHGPDTDIINILYADSTLPLNQAPLAAVATDGSSVTVSAGTPIVNVSNPIRAGDLIALNNANGSTLQFVTGVSGQTILFASGDPAGLNQPNAADGSIATLRNIATQDFPPTTATRVWLVTYYLDFDVNHDTPRLIRQINYNQGQAVALVLEDLQLTYDFVDGATNPTDVETPSGSNGPGQIRKANILLSGRSSSEIKKNGEFLRRTLTTQVSLRSLSYIDRYR
jgi:Tfp pilus assembly protein PilW